MDLSKKEEQWHNDKVTIKQRDLYERNSKEQEERQHERQHEKEGSLKGPLRNQENDEEVLKTQVAGKVEVLKRQLEEQVRKERHLAGGDNKKDSAKVQFSFGNGGGGVGGKELEGILID